MASQGRWYCEVVFAKEGEDTDYNSGYSASLEEPDPDTVWDLVPEGYTIIECAVISTAKAEVTI
jgi:hypothetical protein